MRQRASGRTLEYTDSAVADLKMIRDWLTQPGAGVVARGKLMMLWRKVEALRLAPCLHPAGEHPGVRELTIPGGYRALYRVVPDTGISATSGDIRVLRVFGPGQDRRGVTLPD